MDNVDSFEDLLVVELLKMLELGSLHDVHIRLSDGEVLEVFWKYLEVFIFLVIVNVIKHYQLELVPLCHH